MNFLFLKTPNCKCTPDMCPEEAQDSEIRWCGCVVKVPYISEAIKGIQDL